MKIIIFAITFGIALVMLNNSAFAFPEYCQQIDGQVNCKISILPYPSPKQDYLPGVAEIPKGATIIFKNDGFNVHTATSTSASPEENSYLAVKRIDGVFDTGKLLAGQMSKPFTISEKGEYHYLCVIHDAMRGTIVITDTSTPAETFGEEPIIQPVPGQDPGPIQIPEPEPIPAPPFPGPSEEEKQEDLIEENKMLKEENTDQSISISKILYSKTIDFAFLIASSFLDVSFPPPWANVSFPPAEPPRIPAISLAIVPAFLVFAASTPA